jgi:hypothetical protein
MRLLGPSVAIGLCLLHCQSQAVVLDFTFSPSLNLKNCSAGLEPKTSEEPELRRLQEILSPFPALHHYWWWTFGNGDRGDGAMEATNQQLWRDESSVPLQKLFRELIEFAMASQTSARDTATGALWYLLHAGRDELRKQIWRSPQVELYSQHWSAGVTGGAISTHVVTVIDFARHLKSLADGSLVVDAGSGHGVPLLIWGFLFPKLRFRGYDIVEEKVLEANWRAARLGLKNVEFVTQDLADVEFRLPSAALFYFFNPVHKSIMARVAQQIHQQPAEQPALVLSHAGGWSTGYLYEAGCQPVREKGFHFTLFRCN